ncbi:MAG: response regulator, partial [Burkholderiales bacterium]
MKLIGKLTGFLAEASFRRQLTVTVAASIILLALASSLVNSWLGSRAASANLVEQGRQITRNFAGQAVLALLYASPDNAGDSARATLAFPDVLQVAIYDHRNQPLLVQGVDPGKMEHRPQPEQNVARYYETPDAWYFSAPVYSHGNEVQPESPFNASQPTELLGHVQVVLSKSTLQNTIADIFIGNITISLSFATGLLLLLQAITTRMTRPLNNLSEIMKQAEAGDSVLRAEMKGPSDIIDMAHAFNKMMTVLEERENELKLSRDAALESARVKAEFAANVSHEVRTPINGVLGMLELLDGTALTKKQREHVEIARSSGETLLTLINDILDFSKIEAGKLVLERIGFELRQTLEDVIELLASQAQRKSLGIGYAIAPEVPESLYGDPTRLRQVLTNLVSNGIKFTDSGEVALRVNLDKHEAQDVILRFEVSDTGIGVREDAQAYIFESFSQADGSTTRRYGGTGLGLSICKQLVEMMGGEIAVRSDLGQGSTFWFTVRMRTPTATAAVAETLDLRGLRVLIVDASPISREFFALSFSTAGMHCDTLDAARETVARLHDAHAGGRPYNMAFLDMATLGAKGLELVQQIRTDADLAGVRLVMTTKYERIRHDETADRKAAAAYLNKPVRRAKLYECVAKVMGTPLAPIPEPVQKIEDDGALQGHSVLVVEDNYTNQMVAVGMLARLGCRPSAVDSAADAIEALRSGRYDLVLMDCNMPEMDGYEATQRFRRMEGEDRRTPIIAMTANVRSGERAKCLDSGMDDYLAKPV